MLWDLSAAVSYLCPAFDLFVKCMLAASAHSKPAVKGQLGFISMAQWITNKDRTCVAGACVRSECLRSVSMTPRLIQPQETLNNVTLRADILRRCPLLWQRCPLLRCLLTRLNFHLSQGQSGSSFVLFSPVLFVIIIDRSGLTLLAHCRATVE